MQTAIAVMARCPQVGQGKTRLARAIGAERAYRLYGAFLQDIDHRFARGRRTLIWAFYPPNADFAALSGCSARCVPQQGNDLGERMYHCFRMLCGEGFDRVILIGADIPHVRDEWLDEAETALGKADLVLGPTDDGGYYLIAARKPHDVFSGVPMGTDHVLPETLRKAEASSLRVHLLPRSFDIDAQGDLAQLRQVLRSNGGRVRLPRTAAVLAEVFGDETAE
jgi:rSAM/selenodomain-associated transferase 1